MGEGGGGKDTVNKCGSVITLNVQLISLTHLGAHRLPEQGVIGTTDDRNELTDGSGFRLRSKCMKVLSGDTAGTVRGNAHYQHSRFWLRKTVTKAFDCLGDVFQVKPTREGRPSYSACVLPLQIKPCRLRSR